MKQLPHTWFARDAVVVARDLLGKTVRRGDTAATIVETEAYTTDGASHGRVRTERSRLMHDTFGHWYIYFTYGMHYCANVTTNQGGVGAVLIRAVEPVKGIDLMKARRGVEGVRDLCSGPAKFCQAFGIGMEENGRPVGGTFTIHDAAPLPDPLVVASPRIGIRQATELLWRFSIRDSLFASR
jgi:DNA-3-methyladenine glycosylase